MGADRIIGSGHAVSTENEYKSLRTQWAEIPAGERWKKIILLLTISLFGANYLFIGFLFLFL